MFTMSSTPVVTEYVEYEGKQVQLGKYVVNVCSYTRSSQTGSYARGFKFSDNTYGYVTRQLKGTKYYKPTRFSPDHGETWYESFAEMKKQRSGKIKLSNYKSKEFAFDAIQSINRSYDPQYQWKA